MKRKIHFILLITLMINGIFYARSHSVVPDSLIKNANSVILNKTIKYDIIKLDKVQITKSFSVLILNKSGMSDAHPVVFYDDDTKILELSASIDDSNGIEIHKYKKKDFEDQSAIDNSQLYSDNRVKYLDYQVNAFPFILNFSSTVETNSTAFISDWIPVSNYNQSVIKSNFIIHNHTSSELRLKEYKLNKKVKISEDTNRIEYELSDSPALVQEAFSEALSDRMPRVKFALTEFILKGVKGKASNWKEFGSWYYDELLTGRDEIGVQTKNKIKQLIIF